jgi:hypothetical protein
MAALREEEASAFDNLKKNSCWYCCPIFCRCIPSSCLTNTHSKRICCRAHLIGEHLICSKRQHTSWGCNCCPALCMSSGPQHTNQGPCRHCRRRKACRHSLHGRIGRGNGIVLP